MVLQSGVPRGDAPPFIAARNFTIGASPSQNLHARHVRWLHWNCLLVVMGCQGSDGLEQMMPEAPLSESSSAAGTSTLPTNAGMGSNAAPSQGQPAQPPGAPGSSPPAAGTAAPGVATETDPAPSATDGAAAPSSPAPAETPGQAVNDPLPAEEPPPVATGAEPTTPEEPAPVEPAPVDDPVVNTEPIVLDVAPAWSGHPVPFALVTDGDWQFVAYYDANQRMVAASRRLDEETWNMQTLPTSVGWDSHNYIAMATDEEGHVHVSGNMHNVPLIYFRTTEPYDVSTFEQVGSMVGSNEGSCTYPEFFRGPEGNLVFAYRDGGSGNGDHIFNAYDVGSSRWSRLLDTPLTDGEGQRNAYPVGPIQGPEGYWHLVWVWRDTPDASTNHDISYARTRNLTQWETGVGSPLQLPIRLSTGDIVDPVPSGGGMINNNTKVGFDQENRPIVAYHKFDGAGNTQLYNARLEGGNWVVHQTSNWDYRWDFGGNGTLVFEIELDAPEVSADGTLTQTWYHAQYGGWGAFRLDPDTLEAVETIDPPLPYPQELDEVESSTPGMHARWVEDWTEDADATHRYLLRWESLDSNRDMPRADIPPPTQLRVYGFPTE